MIYDWPWQTTALPNWSPYGWQWITITTNTTNTNAPVVDDETREELRQLEARFDAHLLASAKEKQALLDEIERLRTEGA